MKSFINKERFERQLLMKQVGTEGQAKISKAAVLVVGAGGLGSSILLYLAAVGVGTIGIVDNDILSISNLNRDILYSYKDIGKPKTFIAKKRLLSFNPDINVNTYQERLDIYNVHSLFDSYDIVIDASDKYSTRYLVSDAAVLFNKPLFIGAVNNFHGMAFTVIPKQTACFRCLYPKIPSPKMELYEQNKGIIGTAPGIIGSIVSQNVIKYIIGFGDFLAGKMLLMDGSDNRFDIIPIEKDRKCKVCGEKPSINKLIFSNY